ncbi:putative 3-hydroxyisobutyrate dehydrogenase-like 3 [Cucumis melo var. makuwa]|uniref:Putative 3-hydroxyisobutyrate dehydrogenase-like 3 n=1 Tax=Cucumis melo var. makuwa TaxID=1194695 RepID=A0A5D3BNN2_CUCMM|nr:putative 3-hydroxyisobutyrate dehydrogenase-like 3 [Cucumis melo var. makuwa]
METPYPNPISPTKTRIGWIGIGVMGAAMATRLLCAGYSVTIYARSPSKALDLQSKGALLVNSVLELAQTSDIVFTMVGHPSDVRQNVLDDNGILQGLNPGGVIVDTTSSHPALARNIFTAARAKGCWAVDAPVSGGDIGARDGKLAIFGGGDEGVVNWLLPLFEVLGKVTYVGEAGCGQSCKIANQIPISANLMGLSEGLMFAERAGLDTKKFLEAVRGGAAGSMAMELFGERMIGRDFRPGGYAEYMVKDLGMAVNIVEEGEDERVVVLPGAALIKQLFSAMVANGDGKFGNQGLISVIERLNGNQADPPALKPIADALSRKVAHSAALITKQAPLLRDFERVEIAVSVGEVTSQLAQLSVQSTLRQRIIVAQLNDPYLVEKRRLVETGQGEDFSISSDDGLTFEGRLCVPKDSVVKTELLTEAHSSPFTMHPGRLPRTLKGYTVIWVVVDRLTKSAHFVPGKSTYTASTRLDFSTAFHPQTDGQTERLNQVLEDMLRACVLEFSGSWDSYLHLMEFAYNNSYQATIDMAPFEALYGKCCRSPVCWGEVGRRHGLLKVAPMKGVLRFEKKGKLSPRFVGPFEILERIGPVAYRLALPPSLSIVHDVFHVSMLRKYVADTTQVVDFEPLQISENLSYEEQPVDILAREVKKLRSREISLVQVLWRNHGVEEATWEREEDMRAQHPKLFED